MRRVPTFVWVLTPLVLGVLYALAWPLFAPTPTLMNVVPAEAVLVHRFRDRAALDEGFFRGADDPVLPSERIGPRRNLPGLPGIDRHRPYHLVFLPRKQRPNPTMMIFPVADAGAVRRGFDDPAFFLEHGFVRYAQYLGLRGAFAAVAGDRDAVRHLGEGGITAADLGEDHVLAARVPELVRHALSDLHDPLWGPVLAALGVRADRAETSPEGVQVPTGRVQRVHDTWRTARMWSWVEEGRIRIDLEPAPSPLADRLAAIVSSTAGSPPVLPPPPPDAQAWVRIPGPEARAALAWALFGAGVPFPEALADETDALGALGRVSGSGDGGLMLWAAPAPGARAAWTLGLASPAGALPPLAAFHPALGTAEGRVPLEAGALPLLEAAGAARQESPLSEVLRRGAGGLDVVAAGPAAERVVDRFEAHRAMSDGWTPPEPPEAGLHLVAEFGLVDVRARALLGAELESGGLLRALHGGDVEGTVWTDGRVLRLEASVRRVP